MPCRLAITLRDGRVLTKEMRDYPGFITKPMSWEMAFEKFEQIAGPLTTAAMRRSIADAVKNLESIEVRDLTRMLARIETPYDDDRKHPARGRSDDACPHTSPN
jgi:2-methylcitrate dehydratase